MTMSKRFKSSRKLDSLAVGSRITFGSDVNSPYIKVWVKLPSGKWEQLGDTFSKLYPYSNDVLIQRHAGETFALLA